MSSSLRRCMKEGVNNQGTSDALFITWCIRSMHVQLTHLRMLRAYPARYSYRVMQESLEDQGRLAALVSSIRLDSDQSQLMTPIKTAKLSKKTHSSSTIDSPIKTEVGDIVPAMFLGDLATKSETSDQNSTCSKVQKSERSESMASTPNSICSMVPAIFCTGPNKSVTLEALPAKRGAIRGKFKIPKTTSSTENKFKSCIENAYTGNIRTTLRVKMKGSNGRPSWAEVTKTTCPAQADHHENCRGCGPG